MAETYKTRLQRILREEGRKQSWLAERAGCDVAHISRIANGLHCTEATKRSIAEALGREIGDVFPEPDEVAA